MALELAVAYVRIKFDKAAARKEAAAAKKQIQRSLGIPKINVTIVPRLNKAAYSSVMKQLNAMDAVAKSIRANLGAMGGSVPKLPRGATGSPGGPSGRSSTTTSSLFGGRSTRTTFGGQGPEGFLPTGVTGQVNTQSGASRVRAGGSALSGNFRNFARTSAQIATGILGAQAALGVITFPVKAFQDAKNFESAMVRVKAVTEATDDEFVKLQDAALEMGLKTIFTSNQVADAMVNLGQKGLSAIETINATPLILNFAAAGAVTPEEAADTLVGIMRSINATIPEMEQISDIFARASVKTSLDIKKIGDSFRYIGPLADMAGIKLSEVSTAVGMLVSSNMPGSMAGTSFRRIVGELVNEESVKKMSEMLGVTLKFRDATTGNLIPFADILDQVNAALGENASGADRANFAIQILGQRGGPAFAKLLQNGGAAFRQLNDVMENSSLTAEELALKKMDTMEGASARLLAALEFLSIKAVMPLSEGFQAVSNGIAEVIVKMVKLEGTIPKMLALSAGIYGIGVASLFSFRAFTFLSKSIMSFVFSRGGAVVALFMGIAAAIVYAAGEGETFGEKIENVFDEKIPALLDGVRFAFDNIGLIIEKAGIGWELAIIEAVPGMAVAFETFGAGVVGMIEGISSMWEVLVQNFLAGAQRIASWIQHQRNLAAYDKMVEEGGIDPVLAKIGRDQIEANYKAGLPDLKNPISAFQEGFDEAYGKAKSGFEDQGIADGLRERDRAIDEEIAANEAKRSAAREEARKAEQGRGKSVPVGPSMGGYKPQFIGIQELSKQIQIGLLSKEDKNAKRTADATEGALARLESIDSKIGQMGGTFA